MQECNVEETSDEEEAPSKGSKDKKSNGPDSGKGLMFKITSKVAYKTVLKGLLSVNCSSGLAMGSGSFYLVMPHFVLFR